MIWALIGLAALPLAMGAMMIFMLRSGRLQQLQRRGDDRVRTGDGEGDGGRGD